MEEIQPCLCGTKDYEVKTGTLEKGHEAEWFAYCPACDAHVYGYISKAEAIAAWNKMVMESRS